MRWFNLRCLMLGHDDRIRRVPGRLYLECEDCGRRTEGWDLMRHEAPGTAGPAPARSWGEVCREMWVQARRELFHAMGLR